MHSKNFSLKSLYISGWRKQVSKSCRGKTVYFKRFADFSSTANLFFYYFTMAITKSKKSEILADLENEFKNSKSVAFTAYTGITVAAIQELRRKLRETGARMIIAKKTLISLAAKNSGLKEIPDESLVGPVAVIFSHEDELAGLQLIEKSKKDFKQLEILGGVFDGEVLTKMKAQQLAQLPSRDALLGQIVGLLASPLRGFVGIGNSLIAGFARVVSEIQKQKEAQV